MSEDNPLTGRPYGGRNEKPEESDLPGERPLREDEKHQGAPAGRHRDDHETASRAAEDGAMSSGDDGLVEPTPGIPQRVDAPSPADATDADPPGGSAANQQGRTPDA